MALPTAEDLKTWLRIEDDSEDGLCADLIESAKATAESLIGRPIVATARVFEGVWSGYDDYGRAVMDLSEYPIGGTVVITDVNGDVVESTEYSVNASGRITAVVGSYFLQYPYTVTASVGMELASDYSTRIEPMLRRLILGIAAIDYKQRNPNVVSDSGSSVSVTYQSGEYTDGIPNHLYSIVRKLRPVRVV